MKHIPQLPEGFEVSAVWEDPVNRCKYIQCLKDGYIHHFIWDGYSDTWSKEVIYRNQK